MRVEIGTGGWLRGTEIDVLPDDAVAMVRFGKDSESGRLVPHEVYLQSPSGERIRGEHLRRLPLDVFESVANSDAWQVEANMDAEGPGMATEAARFKTPWGDHWEASPKKAPKLTAPPGGRYTKEWLEQLAIAYNDAFRRWKAKRGASPAEALAAQAQVSTRTVHSWIYRARKAGALPPGKQGSAGA